MRNTVHQLGDEAAALAMECAPLKVHSAGKLYAAYRAGLARPDVFASARSRAFGDVSDLAERSIRAELALALGVSERVASREMTPTQLRKPLARLREELQIEPLTVRHETARERRGMWITPDCDGMAVLSALLPAHVAMGAYNRMDRIARSLRRGEAETRTLAQLRADACADIRAPARDFRVRWSSSRRPAAADAYQDPCTSLESWRMDLDTRRPQAAFGYSISESADLGGAAAPLRARRDARVHRGPRPDLRDAPASRKAASRNQESAKRDSDPQWVASATDRRGHHHVRHGEQWTYRMHPDGTAEWTSPTGRQVTTRAPEVPGATTGPVFREQLFPEDPPPIPGPTPF
ncbi:hypothetical protein HQQ81_10680 [Microbacteriaceae bacterium VKM Ac-2854]|nr:hypothetical protein [Microbacteriaceae bacterium VKM Ac-2854]